MSRLTIVKNAFANLCRGGAAAVVALLLPPFLTRILSKDAYGTWLLILQLSTYVGFLDFGIQTAVGRYVAHCNEIGDAKQRDSIVSTSLAVLIVAGLVAMGGITLLSWQLPYLFKDMPAQLQQDAQLALLCVGISLSVALPASVFTGIFVGLQRYDIPAWILGTSKLLGGLFVILTAHATHSIVMMAVIMSASNLLAAFLLFLQYKNNNLSRVIVISPLLLSLKYFTEVRDYCFGLSIWMLGIIMATGIDTIVLGLFEYKSIVYYNVANIFITVIIGIQNNTISVIMPMTAAVGSQNDPTRVGKILISATRYSTIILILTSAPVVMCGKWFISIWLGKGYVENVVPLLQLLLVANFLRQLSVPYYFVIASLAKQNLIASTILTEGIINCVTSILLVNIVGGVGVAIGTNIGAVLGLGLNFIYNIPRTQSSIQIDDPEKLLLAVLTPLISVVPSTIILLLDGLYIHNDIIHIFNVSISLLSLIYLLWLYGMDESEKIFIIKKLGRNYERIEKN